MGGGCILDKLFFYLFKDTFKRVRFLAGIGICRFREKYLGYRNTINFYLLNILDHFLGYFVIVLLVGKMYLYLNVKVVLKEGYLVIG